MKKYAAYFLMAVFGGVVALGLFALVPKQGNKLVGVPQEQFPVKFASNVSSDGGYPDFIYAANKSIHAVVHITAEYTRKNTYYDMPFDLGDIFGQRNPSPMKGSGSGVIISSDGYIITNNHVVDNASNILVILNDKREYKATVVGTDPSTDLAVIKIDETNLPFLTYGNSDNIQIGEWVLAVGNPFNLTSTVTAGIVSAKARNLQILDPDVNGIESYIQTDAAVNPGNSGGALVNTKGELVGINSAIASTTGSYSGYSFAIPSNLARKVVTDIMDFKAVRRGYLGIQIRDIDSKLATDEGIKKLSGVYVASVVPGGPGALAGLKDGDVITKVNGNPVNSNSELLEQVGMYRPGDKLQITLSRKNEEKTIPVVLRGKDNIASLAPKVNTVPELGAQFSPVPSDLKKKVGIDYGVQISKLGEGKLQDAGIKQGFIITSIDRKPVKSAQDITDALKSASEDGVLIGGVYPDRTRAYYGFGL